MLFEKEGSSGDESENGKEGSGGIEGQGECGILGGIGRWFGDIFFSTFRLSLQYFPYKFSSEKRWTDP